MKLIAHMTHTAFSSSHYKTKEPQKKYLRFLLPEWTSMHDFNGYVQYNYINCAAHSQALFSNSKSHRLWTVAFA